jgi:hypothetical protein
VRELPAQMSSRAHKTWKEGREGRKLNEQIAGGAASGQGREHSVNGHYLECKIFFIFSRLNFLRFIFKYVIVVLLY